MMIEASSSSSESLPDQNHSSASSSSSSSSSLPLTHVLGGAWVVVDPEINSDYMDMYCDRDSRGGILEPDGTVEIKFRKRDLVTMMLLTDAEYATSCVHSFIIFIFLLLYLCLFLLAFCMDFFSFCYFLFCALFLVLPL
jgi:hypothetical protein